MLFSFYKDFARDERRTKRPVPSEPALRHGGRLLCALCCIAIGAAVAIISGCGLTNSSSSNPPPNVTVTVQPATASVPLGQTQQFTATVTGASSSAVNWSVNGVVGGNVVTGTISSSGLYTAPQSLPSPPSVTVTATSQTALSASGSASVQLQSGIVVSVAPNSANVAPGASANFSATVTGAGTSSVAVSWSVNNVAGGNSQFFPKGTFAAEGNGEAIVLNWYSRQLKGLEEPSLWTLSQIDKHAVVYRFLWLRAFHHPVAIRVIVAPDGTGELITKVGGGVGGYAPGPLIENQMKKLSTIEVKYLLDQINGAHFWELPTKEKKKNTYIEIDGAQWILEGIQDGNYHIVDRWSPKKDAYRALCWFFVSKLARLRIPKDQIY